MTFDEFALTRRAMLGAALAAAAAPLFAAKHLTLAEVVRRNTRARGGAAALDRVRSLLMESEFHEGGMTLDGRYAANTAGLVRVDIYVSGKFAGAEGIDSKGVWTWGKNGPEPSVATGAANALTHGAEDKLFGWNRFPQRGHKLSLLAPATIDGVTIVASSADVAAPVYVRYGWANSPQCNLFNGEQLPASPFTSER